MNGCPSSSRGKTVVDLSAYSSTPIAATSSSMLGASGALLAINSRWISGSADAVPSTSSVNVSLILAFFHDELARWGVQLDIILLWITVGLALCAMVVYIIESARTIRKQRA